MCTTHVAHSFIKRLRYDAHSEVSTIWNASPGPVDPSPRRSRRRYAGLPAAALLSGLRMREFPPSRCQRRYADGSDMLISVVRQGFPSASPTTMLQPCDTSHGSRVARLRRPGLTHSRVAPRFGDNPKGRSETASGLRQAPLGACLFPSMAAHGTVNPCLASCHPESR